MHFLLGLFRGRSSLGGAIRRLIGIGMRSFPSQGRNQQRHGGDDDHGQSIVRYHDVVGKVGDERTGKDEDGYEIQGPRLEIVGGGLFCQYQKKKMMTIAMNNEPNDVVVGFATRRRRRRRHRNATHEDSHCNETSFLSFTHHILPWSQLCSALILYC